MKYRMYALVLRQLNAINKGIQAAHCCLEYANSFGSTKEYQSYIQNDKTLILLDGGTSVDLKEIINKLIENEIKFEVFSEPDLDDIVTSVCFLADERVFDEENYPDYMTWRAKNNIPMIVINTYPPIIEEDKQAKETWLSLIGGKKNEVLRDIIKYKRLSF